MWKPFGCKPSFVFKDEQFVQRIFFFLCVFSFVFSVFLCVSYYIFWGPKKQGRIFLFLCFIPHILSFFPDIYIFRIFSTLWNTFYNFTPENVFFFTFLQFNVQNYKMHFFALFRALFIISHIKMHFLTPF